MYKLIRDYEYLEDAREDMKYDSVEVHREAERTMREFLSEDEEPRPYHLEVVKLRWSGNYSQVAKNYTKWFN